VIRYRSMIVGSICEFVDKGTERYFRRESDFRHSFKLSRAPWPQCLALTGDKAPTSVTDLCDRRLPQRSSSWSSSCLCQSTKGDEPCVPQTRR
jgi:hypothetical protein